MKNTLYNRRQFLHVGGAVVAGCTAPIIRKRAPKIVIIGGGVGGLSVLRRLADDGRGAFDITLIEPKRIYTTCFYSNLYVGGLRDLASIQFGYDALGALPGVRMIHDTATAIDADAKQVLLRDGTRLPYDRLVVSPGIDVDYDSVPGWSEAAAQRMPHAWQSGAQTVRLNEQLALVPDGGLVVVIAPPNPYRCPPGPYERVSMMAHALTARGRGHARIVVIDPKESFSKQPLFQQGWERHYPGMIEWLPPMIHDGVRRVDVATMTVETGFETYRNCDLVNVIPRQVAGAIARRAGLTDAGGYCPIDAATMKSQHHAEIFVLGDAAIAGDMPKSAYAAHSQANIVAQVIRQELRDEGAVTPNYRNRCWSLVDESDSVFVGGTYAPTAGKIAQIESEISTLDDTAAVRLTNYGDSAAWYLGLTSTLFG